MDKTYKHANGKVPNAVASGLGMAFLYRVTKDIKYKKACDKIYADYLKKVAMAVVSHKISQYPIFILHRQGSLPFGRSVINAEEQRSDWSINVSFLEEFAQLGLIHANKVNAFKQSYKNPEQFVCLFIIFGDADASFAFLAYNEGI